MKNNNNKKFADLYLNITLNYNYIIPYIHSLIYDILNIDLDHLIFTMITNTKNKNIFLPNHDISKIKNNKSDLNNIIIKKKKYKFIS
jgi:uncharacterized protein YueI